MILRIGVLVTGFVIATFFAWGLPKLNQVPTQFEIALDLLRIGRAEDAAILFEKPDWSGIAQYRAGRYQRALGAFYLDETPLSRYNMGVTYARMHQWEAAISAFERVLRMEPGHVDATHNLGIVRSAAELARRLTDESRPTITLGIRKDGDREIPEREADDGTKEGKSESGNADAGTKTSSDTENEKSGQTSSAGRDGLRARAEQKQAGVSASAAPNAAESPVDLVGISAGAHAAESKQAAEILLRQLQDDSAKVLRARLYSAYKNRVAGRR